MRGHLTHLPQNSNLIYPIFQRKNQMKATKVGNISGQTQAAKKLMTSSFEKITPKEVRRETT